MNWMDKVKLATADTISLDVPLFIRMLEWAHEDAKTDMQLHQATKNLIGMAGEGPLTMANYNAAVGGEGMPEIPAPGVEKKAEKCPITGKEMPGGGRGLRARMMAKLVSKNK